MTLRDELIKLATEAIEDNMGVLPYDQIAAAALDAILARLSEPSEGMLDAPFVGKRADRAAIFRAMLATVSKGVGG